LPAAGRHSEAQQRLHQALQLAAEIQFVPLNGFDSECDRRTFAQSTDRIRIKVLAFVRQHPASDHATQAEAQQLLDRYRTEAGQEKTDFLAAAQAYAENRTLQDVVVEVNDGYKNEPVQKLMASSTTGNKLNLPALAMNYFLPDTHFINTSFNDLFHQLGRKWIIRREWTVAPLILCVLVISLFIFAAATGWR